MSKFFVFIGILTLASVSARAGMFTNTGSASETCIWDGSGAPVPPDVSEISVTGTGANINLICPGHGVYGFNSLTISSALLTGGHLIEVPEPSSLSLYGVALLALFLRSCRLSRRLG